ncbi:hypothetical protein ACFWIB_37375 [Streptomyces sp. NPDC127051]|uniref:nucleotide-binding protein n=1 Tax=Streptomyces sp. NPDC127051 TaxID=3347119 RepID=UPI00365B0FAD
MRCRSRVAGDGLDGEVVLLNARVVLVDRGAFLGGGGGGTRRAPCRRHPKAEGARRFVLGNQKGRFGKSAISDALAQALTETRARICVIDFAPQGHLSPAPRPDHARYQAHQPRQAHARRSLRQGTDPSLVPIEYGAFVGGLFLLPLCGAFLPYDKLATTRHVRTKETALEKALEDMEASLTTSSSIARPASDITMDTALYYAQTRDGEEPDHRASPSPSR